MSRSASAVRAISGRSRLTSGGSSRPCSISCRMPSSLRRPAARSGLRRALTRMRGGDVILAVVDTGIGIAASDQQRVFEKFERAGPRSQRCRRRARPVAGQEPDRAARRCGYDPLRGGRRNNRPVPPAGQPAPAGRQGRRAGAPGLVGFRARLDPVERYAGFSTAAYCAGVLLGRHRDRALVVHDPADPRLLLGRKLRDVDRQIGAGRHAALAPPGARRSPRTSA